MEYILRKCGCGSEASMLYYWNKFAVYCDNEFCINCSGEYKTKAEAIRAWNEKDWKDGKLYDDPNA